MTRLLAVALSCCLISSIPRGVSGQDQRAVNLEVVRLSDNTVIVRNDGPQSTNLIVLNTQAGLVVIDTGTSAAVAEAARQRLVEIFGRDEFAYVINTHDHGDHTYGNQAFADLPIIGHEYVPERMEAGEDRRQQTHQQITSALVGLRERLAGVDPGSEEAGRLQEAIASYEGLASDLGEKFRLTKPSLTFLDRMTLDLGDRSLELVFFGKAHSDTDILVFCPEEGLLATGDIFVPGENLYIDSERVPSLPRWAENLEWILDEGSGVRTVVPGHQDPFPLEELVRIRDFVTAQQTLLEGKSSAFVEFQQAFEEEGMEAGLRRMDELHGDPNRFFFFHAEFDSFVYRLMLDEEFDRAIPLFEKLAALFPSVPNAFDSLGEVYMRADREQEAIAAFEQCLDLDPEHQNALRRLAEIRG